MKIKDLIATIELDGWQQVRQKGSHRQFYHPIKSGTVTVLAVVEKYGKVKLDNL